MVVAQASISPGKAPVEKTTLSSVTRRAGIAFAVAGTGVRKAPQPDAEHLRMDLGFLECLVQGTDPSRLRFAQRIPSGCSTNRCPEPFDHLFVTCAFKGASLTLRLQFVQHCSDATCLLFRQRRGFRRYHEALKFCARQGLFRFAFSLTFSFDCFCASCRSDHQEASTT